mmetsp:Transcript_8637/g.18443  ORF Transcript_8637/g.18443 Transcript_8637/m.18443 type:complete len:245 (-) Transcript_8637:160-894(-)|eukprot:CAMPEP_0171368992 /NCGR_PEP_ID=MMETSP0879-20121228/7085_1 /TAXON_ID=67004 /ORGANISM="Thalassiosira weissflogii, Strain CCMP1336" /LENGTH=244 /DNA_ID=CAMNT_0011877249 /DNA_START=96 /DNA_END=830 /DNA_ORIENTATION=+
MTSQFLGYVRRTVIGGTTGIAGYSTYKVNTNPLHIFWDLDHTILCSISPLPESDEIKDQRAFGFAPTLRYFDQIDDDFPFDPQTPTPNTRTYFRPGARLTIWLCSFFATNHVYTAAQRTYTENILKQIDPDRKLFHIVIHRDDYPQIVKEGKDLKIGTSQMERAILFDDRTSNFKPQHYQNGVGVLPFTPTRVEQCLGGSWMAYFEELGEMGRLLSVAFLGSVHWSGDVRKVVMNANDGRHGDD